MLSRAIQDAMSWLRLYSVILIPGGFVLAMWISLSHRGEFELSWKEKASRLIIFLCLLALLGFLISYVSDLGPKPYGWDETTV
jgi:hypothetical protein